VKINKPFISFFSLAILLFSKVVLADALSLSEAMKADTIAQYYIEDDGVKVELEIGMKSIDAFKNILPDAIYQDMGYGKTSLQERLTTFWQKEFFLAADNGNPLEAFLLSIEPGERLTRDVITGEPIKTEQDQIVIKAQLFFPFAKENERPSSLTLGSLNGQKVSIGFVAYHKAIAINEFRYLSNAFTLKLDWDDPWYSEFTTRNLRRTYFSSMNGFIYVEPFEIRKEIIVRPKDIQQWVDLGIDGKKTIKAEEQEQLLSKVADFLANHLPVTVDGVAIELPLERINFLERTLTSSRVIDPPEDLDADAAIIGIIYVLPTEGLPELVEMTWDLFNEKITQISASATDELGPLPTILEPDFNVLRWENFIKEPTIPGLVELAKPASTLDKTMAFIWPVASVFALLVIVLMIKQKQFNLLRFASVAVLFSVSGIAYVNHQQTRLDQHKVNALIDGLLGNIYHAFDFHQEGKIYDTLEHSIDGDLLTDIYLEMKKGLVLANQGGAQAKVKSIEIEDVTIEQASSEEFSAITTWKVSGSVGHWGHIHERLNKYQAKVSVKAENGRWKMNGIDILLEERL
jgi:hypothetical protein